MSLVLRTRSRGRPRLAFAVLAACVAAAAVPVPLGAQLPEPDGPTPLLPDGHWSLDALARLDGLGLLPDGFDPGASSVTLREAFRLTGQALLRAEGVAPELASLPRAYRARLAEEFPGLVPDGRRRAGGAFQILGATVGAVYERQAGRVLAGIGYAPDNWTGIRPLDDETAGMAQGRVAVAIGRYLALSASGVFDDQAAELRGGHIAATWRSALLWAGRRSPAFGNGVGGGVVLSGSTSFDAVGFTLAEPWTAPGFLRALGPLRFEMLLSRLERNGAIEEPWLWAGRASVAPHPRLDIGISRAIMFGGEGNSPLTLRTFAYMLVGKHAGVSGEFDNQVVSLDLRYRPPLGPLPLVAYLEWGFDDSAGSWKDVPGLVAGAVMPAVPGLPELALGLEYATFAASCCGNTVWYRNWAFRGGWTDAGRALGHALGGHGREWAAYARADLWAARVRIAARTFVRRRGGENLYAPERRGSSAGAAVDVEARVAPTLELFLDGTLEDGESDWRSYAVAAGVRWLF